MTRKRKCDDELIVDIATR